MATVMPHKARRRLLSLSVAGAVIAAIYVLGGPTVWAADAPIDSGSVTVVDPVVRTKEITNARSATEFSLQLPAGEACPGDSLHDQWRWQTFVIPAADDPGAIVYEVQGPSGPGQWPLFDTRTHPLVDEILQANAAPNLPGAVPAIDALSFAVFPPGTLPAGNYRIGVACTLFRETAKYWSTEIVITDAPNDKPAKFVWRLSTAPEAAPESSSSSSPWLIVAAAAAVVAVLGWLLARRSARTISANSPISKEKS